MSHFHPEDRPDPSEQPIRARVPDHVSTGTFSTGVIVMTAQTEFILDFVQNLGRPHQIISRVVMPHNVLPQLVDALQRNIELYRNRWGELPQTGMTKNEPPPGPLPFESPGSPPANRPNQSQNLASGAAGTESQPAGGTGAAGSPAQGKAATEGGTAGPASTSSAAKADGGTGDGDATTGGGGQSNSGGRQTSVQEIYDDLKIRDEMLSGAYANAVMIGHGPHEFSFDFITNFYPNSAVSARVFLAAGQIPRLYESLKGTWEQLRSRMQQPPPGRQPPPPTSFSDEDNPFA